MDLASIKSGFCRMMWIQILCNRSPQDSIAAMSTGWSLIKAIAQNQGRHTEGATRLGSRNKKR